MYKVNIFTTGGSIEIELDTKQISMLESGIDSTTNRVLNLSTETKRLIINTASISGVVIIK